MMGDEGSERPIQIEHVDGNLTRIPPSIRDQPSCCLLHFFTFSTPPPTDGAGRSTNTRNEITVLGLE